MNFKIFKHKITLNTNQTIALTFLFIIILGSILLSLPISLKSPENYSYLTALFTSTSAVCVTGLSLVDIYTTYSSFGQLVLLLLMETGGLGFMSIVAILFHITNHNSSIESLSLMAESIGSDGLKSVTRIQKRLLIGSLLFEGTGAIILFISFLPYYSAPTALWFGIFHAVSAFCNAGFDLMGITSPGDGLTVVNTHPAIIITIALLIIIGGIGFLVWDDIVSSKHIRKWSVYTKLVMTITPALLLISFILFFWFEKNNSSTIAGMSLSNKLANSFFQAATTRTAGFASVSQEALTDRSLALTIILMIIGGSAGSTAGGIKTVTFLILLKTIISTIHGEKRVMLFYRTITIEQIAHAFTLACSFIILTIIGGFIISTPESVSFIRGYFESVSAMATVGLSLNLTGSLNFLSKITVIILMYIGRVGVLTLVLGFFRTRDTSDIQYPTTKLLIG